MIGWYLVSISDSFGILKVNFCLFYLRVQFLANFCQYFVGFANVGRDYDELCRFLV